jgi:alpha-D-ribose 1-methylphosphonate 5-triphosphate diphosphatase PhnM
MKRKYKKPAKSQQFTICAKKAELLTFEKKKKKIKQFTDAEREQFEAKRKENESTWSKIDRATIDRQCDTKEVWED